MATNYNLQIKPSKLFRNNLTGKIFRITHIDTIGGVETVFCSTMINKRPSPFQLPRTLFLSYLTNGKPPEDLPTFTLFK